jgi:hypothetical protein
MEGCILIWILSNGLYIKISCSGPGQCAPGLKLRRVVLPPVKSRRVCAGNKYEFGVVLGSQLRTGSHTGNIIHAGALFW